MNLDASVAIDIHTHAGRTCHDPYDPVGKRSIGRPRCTSKTP